ncbi:MAG: hypothetical protein BMS9Abin23_0767 [Thermodesulfobacteriota bacterium]|nr:MAG: hypothetical protein BMS9Abin23_0767 [Thermodesulfobacteriota bacterium]
MSEKQDLELLDRNLTRLKIEYEQYFMGILKREPLKLREDVEMTVRQFTYKKITNTALQFKFNSLVARFNSYRQYWTRTLRAIEEGTYTKRAETSLITRGADGDGREERAVTTPPLKNSRAAGKGTPTAHDMELDRAYKEYLEARVRCNKPVKGLTLEKFFDTVKKSREKIEKNYGVKETELKVIEKDGTVKLALRPKGKG